MTAIRRHVWMALTVCRHLRDLQFLKLRCAHHGQINFPEEYARFLDPKSIPLRYRFTLFNTTFDRRDVKLDRYLPTRRAYFVAFVLWAMVGVASIITSAPSESGVAKYLQHFSDFAPGFASCAAGS